MTNRIGRSLTMMSLLALVCSGCEDYDPPEEANPFDTIAPAPGDTTPPSATMPSGDG